MASWDYDLTSLIILWMSKQKKKKKKTELGPLMTLLRCCLNPAKLTFKFFFMIFFDVNHFKVFFEFESISPALEDEVFITGSPRKS